MADTKQTKTVGEHHVASELARRGWAPALTRDGLERTDILAVHSGSTGRRQIEVQVKAARGKKMEQISWVLGSKTQAPSAHECEYFVLVAIPENESLPLRDFVVPRSHIAAAAWIGHMAWLTEPGVPKGQRNAPVERARIRMPVFSCYEGRWDLLHQDQSEVPVLLPADYRELALNPRVGLPEGHEWRLSLPEWP